MNPLPYQIRENMVKIKVPVSERKSLKKLLRQYYAGSYAKLIGAKAAEKNVNLSDRDVYNYFNQGIDINASLINEIGFALVQDAKQKDQARKETLKNLQKA